MRGWSNKKTYSNRYLFKQVINEHLQKTISMSGCMGGKSPLLICIGGGPINERDRFAIPVDDVYIMDGPME